MAMDSAATVLEDALGYPTSDEDWLVTVLVGGLLLAVYYFFSLITSFFPLVIVVTFVFLLVPVFFLGGFVATTVRAVLAGENLPQWSDAGLQRLLTDGAKLWVVGLVYTAALVVPLTVLAGGLGVLGGAGGHRGSAALLGVASMVLFVVYLAGVLAVSYLLPAAVVNFARRGSLGAAFDVGTLKEVVTAREYLVGWLLAVAVNVLAIVAAAVVSITLVGILLIPWILFFFLVAAVYVYTQAYAGALDVDIPVTDADPAGG